LRPAHYSVSGKNADQTARSPERGRFPHADKNPGGQIMETLNRDTNDNGNNWKIRVNGKSSITIRGCHEITASLVIPPQFYNIPVAIIEKKAFKCCELDNIAFPPTIEHIEQEAFSKNHLTELVLSAVFSLATAAFYKNHIKRLVLPQGLESIGDFCFYGNCIENLELPDTLHSIGVLAFGENPIKAITIGPNVTLPIGHAFSPIPGFEPVYHKNAKKAGRYVFSSGEWYIHGR
jgi:hypothetical protein